MVEIFFCWSLLTSGGHIAPVEVDLSKLVAAGQTAPGHCRDHGGPPQYAVSDNSYCVIVISDAAISFMHSWKLARKRTTKMSKISKHWIKVLKVLFQMDLRRIVSPLTRRSQRRSWRCVRCSGGQSWQGLGHSQTTRMQRHLLPQSHLKSEHKSLFTSDILIFSCMYCIYFRCRELNDWNEMFIFADWCLVHLVRVSIILLCCNFALWEALEIWDWNIYGDKIIF